MTHCFVPGCDAGYPERRRKNREEGKRNAKIFRAPKDPDTLMKWRQVIPTIKDKILQHSDGICEAHFEEDMIDRVCVFNEAKHTETEKMCLKPGAVPSIFPIITRKAPKKRSRKKVIVTTVKKRKADLCFSATRSPELTEHEALIRLPLEEMLFSSVDRQQSHGILQAEYSSSFFDVLLNDITSVRMPSQNWSATLVTCRNALMWTAYDTNYTISKRVVVCKDLSVKVFVWGREVYVNRIPKPHSADDVTAILATVENLRPCINSRFSLEYCIGYVEPLQTGRILQRCLPCRLHWKSEARKPRAAPTFPQHSCFTSRDNVESPSKKIERLPRKKCAVVGCANSYSKLKEWRTSECHDHPGLRHHECSCLAPFSLHRIPKNDDVQRLWITALQRKHFQPHPSSRICSRHFLDGRPTVLNPLPISSNHSCETRIVKTPHLREVGNETFTLNDPSSMDRRSEVTKEDLEQLKSELLNQLNSGIQETLKKEIDEVKLLINERFDEVLHELSVLRSKLDEQRVLLNLNTTVESEIEEIKREPPSDF